MVKAVSSVLIGLFVWILVATLLNWGIRLAIPGYTAAEPTLAFTLTMKFARLTLALLASLAAGFVARSISPRKSPPWVIGIILLLTFVPFHLQIWSQLPVWYHLFFLLTLLPTVLLGARLRQRENS